MIRHHQRIAPLACAAIAIALLCWFYLSKSRPDEKAVTAAEDEVYEAVVRDMVTPTHGQTKMSELVFDDAVLTERTPEEDMNSCTERARKQLGLEQNTRPHYDSLADKIYRVFAHGFYSSSLQTNTIQDYLEKSCTVGHLSTTFHTDLPRTFIATEGIHFEGWPVEKDGPSSFEQRFPGATGVISFSPVGFDSNLREAIVSTSFVCGGVCGTGRRYVLKKTWGRWEVANKWMLWVS
jgi:hypothetical protein